MEDILIMQMQSAGIQVLESTYIIATSKNIETIKSRFEFLVQRLSTLRQGQNTPQYSSSVQWVMDRYKDLYYDRPLQDYQLSILSNLNNFDLNDFYSNSLLNAMTRFCAEQAEEINAMKKESPKTKRAAKVLEAINKTIYELQTKCALASSYSDSLSELTKLQTSFTRTT